MANTGTGFGVGLYGLEQIAKSDLPTAAGVYESAASKCDSANGMLKNVTALRRRNCREGDRGRSFRNSDVPRVRVVLLFRRTFQVTRSNRTTGQGFRDKERYYG